MLGIGATPGPFVSSKTFLFADGPWAWGKVGMGKSVPAPWEMLRAPIYYSPVSESEARWSSVTLSVFSRQSRRGAVPGRTMRWKAAGERTGKIPAPPWTGESTRFCGGRGRAWVWVYQAQEAQQAQQPRLPAGGLRSYSWPLILLVQWGPRSSSPASSSSRPPPRKPPREEIQVFLQPPQGPPCTLGRREAGGGLSLLGWAWRASEGWGCGGAHW